MHRTNSCDWNLHAKVVYSRKFEHHGFTMKVGRLYSGVSCLPFNYAQALVPASPEHDPRMAFRSKRRLEIPRTEKAKCGIFRAVDDGQDIAASNSRREGPGSSHGHKDRQSRRTEEGECCGLTKERSREHAEIDLAERKGYSLV